MSLAQTDKRIDPLIDAYWQASELEAQYAEARPNAAMRAAVFAHARVVAQSATTTEPMLWLSEATRATPAANESRPIWRVAAGVMLGLAGLWMYQLTRPGTTDETNVAVITSPQSGKSVASKSSGPTVASSATVTDNVASSAASSTMANSTAAALAQHEKNVAVAALSKPALTPTPAKAVRESFARERSAAATTNTVGAGAGGPGDAIADAARSDTSVALAKVDTLANRNQQPARVATAPPSPEVSASEPFAETSIASADGRKASRQSAAERPAAVATPSATTASPNAFPRTSSGAMMAAAPPPAASAAPLQPAASPQSATVAGNAEMRRREGSTPETAMFSAVRIGNVNALRAALARGANVNSRDETGLSAMQIARQRNDTEMVKALEIAGAK